MTTIPEGYCLMPISLTAENGAKGALSGEFFTYHNVECYDCDGTGEGYGDDDECETCEGAGSLTEKTTIPWDVIKDIYSEAVKFCAIEAAPLWVKCSDRMPPEGIDVLCAAEFDWAGDWRRKVGYWHNSKWVVYGASWTPTHWMDLPPIPQPPTD